MDVRGTARDARVKAVRDAFETDFDTTVLLGLTAAVSPENVDALTRKWSDDGIWVS